MASRCENNARSSSFLWAYLSDPMPTRGSQYLFEQKRIVDALAAGRRIERYIVDSGGTETAEGRGERLQMMIDEIHEMDRPGTLLVASASCLTATRSARQGVLAALLAADIGLEDPSGVLRPSRTTVALALTAARRARRCKPAVITVRLDV